MFVKEAELLKELAEAEEALAKGEDGALERFEELQQKAQDGDALNMEALVDRVAQQMGFGEADLDALVASFSVAGGRCASGWPKFCSRGRMSYCWMSRRTTWTWKVWNGSRLF